MKEQRTRVIFWAYCLLALIIIPTVLQHLLVFLLFGTDEPVTYQLPQAAKIIEEKSSRSDFFGDYSYGAIFKMPPSEVKILTAKGFDWVTFDFSLEEKPQWKTGKLDSMILKQIKDGNFELKDSPDPKKNYKYIYHNGNQGFRIFAIDEAQDKVYYYRATW
jgi:hypothetical protein